jgi:hypothetical protein
MGQKKRERTEWYTRQVINQAARKLAEMRMKNAKGNESPQTLYEAEERRQK